MYVQDIGENSCRCLSFQLIQLPDPKESVTLLQNPVPAFFANTQDVACMVHYYIFQDLSGIAGITSVMHFILQSSYKWLFHGECILVISIDSFSME